ncbi:MAG: hypothetical protein ACE366_12545 [Bradymonadia bacterium]
MSDLKLRASSPEDAASETQAPDPKAPLLTLLASITPEQRALVISALPAQRRWTWGDPAITTHGVQIAGLDIEWFSESPNPHGTQGFGTQSWASFIQDGQQIGPKPPAEIAEALDAALLTALSAAL